MFGQTLGRTLTASRCARSVTASKLTRVQHFSTSSALLRRQEDRPEAGAASKRRTNSLLEDDAEDLWDAIDEPADVEDSPSSGHILIQMQRELLQYMRLIEHEIPKLVAYRKPFVPPTDDQPVILRSMHYQGEPHPATGKRVVVVPVDKLPLKNETALHKFILLAGPRWTPTPPADAGVSPLDSWGNGYIKISCEDFPKPSQNLKWASDTLDKLITEANDGKDTFADVPLDMRHIFAKVKKQKKGDHLGNRVFHRPSVRDFPQEWLPEPQPSV
ncbi:mitochondrial ribosomal subunit protein-domain-containing protein [Crepidotus variabilis]|uniref:Mitochondrial ribosomal subunit protein-domain-containing protein n=1 Tax=Crepidotus variabilis TaxID=179855 RepID=A0A9P6EV08_9AGAR|nr:mitochondrial ribosomal subunit protein-domain-containing protein [Crepidotus variabilis]